MIRQKWLISLCFAEQIAGPVSEAEYILCCLSTSEQDLLQKKVSSDSGDLLIEWKAMKTMDAGNCFIDRSYYIKSRYD